MNSATLLMSDVVKSFSGRTILSKVSLSVSAGQVCALIGDNGSGKTTLLNLCAGFLIPDSGAISIAGKAVRPAGSGAGMPVAYVPDHVGLYNRFSAIENIQFFEQLRGTRCSRNQCIQFLERLHFPGEAMDRPVATFSKGMRQKVALAAGVRRHACVFILDEPTGGLDKASSDELLVILREVALEGAAVIFSTHSREQVQHAADLTALIQNGHLEVGAVVRN